MTDMQVALIRGINVGKSKRVPMAELRDGVEELGFTNVKTLLNSGNVVYSATGTAPQEAAARIEGVLAGPRIGVPARVIVLTAAEVAQIVAENGIGAEVDNPSRLFVAIPRDPAELRLLDGLMREDWGTEKLAISGRAAYFWCPDGSLDSRLPEAVARVLKDRVTTRNWGTMLKLRALTSAE
ncbi:DUF1697 domain-containing protein [Longimicrobium terrae]|uniref:Uncharacterized protein (DUF1697 family) n=1 Tax=Longimicrobium terrae TaxID=1639882 RepID=A0A841GPE2_9BACT|nr:DUF1697 domain-containing protein [Longimicrobium terrae]MBB4634827.1 uncharacterized protein (DUF1697 family) [Longimicrobium terrae]MBB6069222.1 uncharacterized protein (DUF1697 family) [Longimicrobium terrae]